MRAQAVTEHLLRRDKTLLVILIGLLFGLAGLYTVYGVGMDMTAFEMTAMRGMKDMPVARAPGDWTAGYAILVFLMWWVMMAAMMLPSVSPTALLYASLLRSGDASGRAPVAALGFVAGYLVSWAGFGAIAAATQWVLESVGYVSATMMTLTGTVPGGIFLIAAGLFQFTPLKRNCLRHCRSPVEFLVRRKRTGRAGPMIMGLEHGIYCVGCCWVLMALLFVGGIMNLYWIVALAALAALERLTRFGETVAKAAGVLLTAWGISVLAVAM